MQSTLFEPTDLPELEIEGAVTHAVFVDPFLTMIGMVVLGILLMLALRSRGKAGLGVIILLVSGLLAGALYMTSRIVTTDREVLSNRARSLVDSVAQGNEPSMRDLFDPLVRVQTRFGGAQGADGVVSLASTRVPRLVQSHRVPEVRADLPGPRVGRTMIKVRIDGSLAPSSSWWMVHWSRPDAESDDWRATLIEPVWIQGVTNPGG